MLLFEVIDIFILGIVGVLNAFVAQVDFSDVGGEGGVCVSERPGDDAVFLSGVSSEGEESVVVGESSERGEAESGTGSNGESFLL